MRATMPPTASTVTDWNAIALQFLAPATFSSTRILAMTHLAIYDSVMAITHDHEPYAVYGESAALDLGRSRGRGGGTQGPGQPTPRAGCRPRRGV